MDERTRALANLMAKRLIQRRDVKALQSPTGAYSPVRNDDGKELAFTLSDLDKHIAGQVTFGHYLVDQQGLVRTLAFDVDFDKNYEWRGSQVNPRHIFGTDHPIRGELNAQIRGIADGLAWRLKRFYPQLIVATAFSGSKGIHVYGMFEEATTAETAREVALNVLDSYGCFSAARGKNFYRHDYLYDGLTIEVFPKQEKIGEGGFGNLLRLPLGVNKKTNRRAFFYDPRAAIQEMKVVDPLMALFNGTVVPQ